ncbi:MAG: DEAD/DEAH box helicase [Asgard group archaeon]|nr:DEAD/DEAH box helicase [Asgard group archaeon]
MPKSVILEPLRALAEEKAKQFSNTYKEFDIDIHMSMSEIDFNEQKIRSCDILISTFERFKIILGRMPELFPQIKQLIIDEFHLISDKSRGQTIESILTVLKESARVILLSATIANPEIIAEWISGRLIHSKKRKIPLTYEIITTLNQEFHLQTIFKKNIIENAQVLVFCGTRQYAELLAQKFALKISLFCKQQKSFDPHKNIEFLESIPLPQESIGNELIFQLVEKGTAFHHAGLDRVTQQAIETLFRTKKIKVLFCTETLGAGVNLPAREVIILNCKRWNNDWLSRNIFHQIAGRAGRPGYDYYGRCLIFAPDRRIERKIRERYWKKNDSMGIVKNTFLEPKYDKVKSSINLQNNFEKYLLTLIYERQPTRKELLLLLNQSFFQFLLNREENIEQWFTDKKKVQNFYNSVVLEKDFLKHREVITNISTKQFEIIDLYQTPSAIVMRIQDKSKLYEISLLNNKILKCSCKTNSWLCQHKLFFLKHLSKRKQEEILHRSFSYLSQFYRNGLLREDSSGRISPSFKGKICVEMGLNSDDFLHLQHWLNYSLFYSKPSIKELLRKCLEKLCQNNKEYLSQLNPNLKYAIYEHVIRGQDFQEVVQKFHLYEGDLLRIEGHLINFLSGLIPLSNYLGLTQLENKLQTINMLLAETLYRTLE